MSGAVNGNGNGDKITYRWTTNLLITIVGVLIVSGVGWLKSSQDQLTVTVSNLATQVQKVSDAVGSVDDIKNQTQKNTNDISALKYQTANDQNWINAQINASSAHRKLQGIAPVPLSDSDSN